MLGDNEQPSVQNPGAEDQEGGAGSVADKNQELETRIQQTTTAINETRALTTASTTEMTALNRAR